MEKNVIFIFYRGEITSCEFEKLYFGLVCPPKLWLKNSISCKDISLSFCFESIANELVFECCLCVCNVLIMELIKLEQTALRHVRTKFPGNIFRGVWWMYHLFFSWIQILVVCVDKHYVFLFLFLETAWSRRQTFFFYSILQH